MTNVDSKVTVDFDHHSPDYAQNSQSINAELRAKCPVAHSDQHGGFWVVSRYEDVVAIAKDDETFQSSWKIDGKSPYGVNIPPSPNPHYPIEMDPPEYTPYRKLLNPLFSPATSKTWEPRIAHWVDVCLDEVIEAGRFDMVLDLANPVPALFTCELLGLPIEQWRTYADLAHESIYTPPSQRADVVRRYGEMMKGVVNIILSRQATPKDDLISALTIAEIDGSPMPVDMIRAIVHLIMAGGFDTTTAVAANALIYLGDNPDMRQRLIDDPDRIPRACEEFLRYYTPQQALARTVAKPVCVAGVQLQRGDRALISWASANHDERAFESPDKLNIDRFPNRHTAFGIGIHRCLGSHLARAELITMVQRVLQRMPDYVVDHESARRYPTIGIVNGWIDVPATFTPGQRITADHLPAPNRTE
jgi:cytochrome P450